MEREREKYFSVRKSWKKDLGPFRDLNEMQFPMA